MEYMYRPTQTLRVAGANGFGMRYNFFPPPAGFGRWKYATGALVQLQIRPEGTRLQIALAHTNPIGGCLKRRVLAQSIREKVIRQRYFLCQSIHPLICSVITCVPVSAETTAS